MQQVVVAPVTGRGQTRQFRRSGESNHRVQEDLCDPSPRFAYLKQSLTFAFEFNGTVSILMNPTRVHGKPVRGDFMDQQRFDALKQKYDAVLKTIKEQGVQITHLHEDQGKLVIGGTAPSDAAKNRVWDKIKQVDSAYQDLKADITVDTSMAPASATQASQNRQGEEQTYTVEAGDSLSKISKQFYGEASLYMSIFEANRDQLADPNKIQPGMQLRIPTRGKQVA